MYTYGSRHFDNTQVMLTLLLMQCELLLEREFIATLENLGCVRIEENLLMFGNIIK